MKVQLFLLFLLSCSWLLPTPSLGQWAARTEQDLARTLAESIRQNNFDAAAAHILSEEMALQVAERAQSAQQAATMDRGLVREGYRQVQRMCQSSFTKLQQQLHNNDISAPELTFARVDTRAHPSQYSGVEGIESGSLLIKLQQPAGNLLTVRAEAVRVDSGWYWLGPLQLVEE